MQAFIAVFYIPSLRPMGFPQRADFDRLMGVIEPVLKVLRR